jgi:predicted DNA-binding transcriptional regulator AlpA
MEITVQIISYEQTSSQRAIRLPRVLDLTSVSRATIWRWVKSDQTFPKPFNLSPGITVWDEGELLDWIESKKSERGMNQ